MMGNTCNPQGRQALPLIYSQSPHWRGSAIIALVSSQGVDLPLLASLTLTIVAFVFRFILIAGQVIGQAVSQSGLDHHQLSLRVQRRGRVPAPKAKEKVAAAQLPYTTVALAGPSLKMKRAYTPSTASVTIVIVIVCVLSARSGAMLCSRNVATRMVALLD